MPADALEMSGLPQISLRSLLWWDVHLGATSWHLCQKCYARALSCNRLHSSDTYGGHWLCIWGVRVGSALPQGYLRQGPSAHPLPIFWCPHRRWLLEQVSWEHMAGINSLFLCSCLFTGIDYLHPDLASNYVSVSCPVWGIARVLNALVPPVVGGHTHTHTPACT